MMIHTKERKSPVVGSDHRTVWCDHHVQLPDVSLYGDECSRCAVTWTEGCRALISLIVSSDSESKISCHVLVKRAYETNDVSQGFMVSVPSSQLARRGNALCITFTALRNHLRASISNSRVGTTETLIENIVCGSDSPPSYVKVATSRAPDFGASYRNFNNAFRQLGPLQSFGNDVQPPSNDFNFSLDILALVPSAAASTYLKPWIDMGVSCESHFILFFIFEPSMPNLLCTPQPFVHEQEFGVGPEDSISRCHSPSELSSLTSSSALSSPLPSDSRRSRSWSPYRVRDPVVMDICAAHVPNFDQLKALATFKGGAKATLPSLALTFYSMTQILEGLSLQPDNLNASGCFTQAGVQKKLNTRQVIEAFGWSASTFDNKRKLYKNAQKIALKNWKGDVPEGISYCISSMSSTEVKLQTPISSNLFMTHTVGFDIYGLEMALWLVRSPCNCRRQMLQATKSSPPNSSRPTSHNNTRLSWIMSYDHSIEGAVSSLWAFHSCWKNLRSISGRIFGRFLDLQYPVLIVTQLEPSWCTRYSSIRLCPTCR